MKTFFLIITYLLFAKDCNAQKMIKKNLFFNQDTSFFVGCGDITEINILFFTSDTSLVKDKKNEYYLAVKCAGSYEKNFFKKGQKYSMLLSKNFKEIISLIPRDVFREFSKEKNFYYAKNIMLLKKKHKSK